MATCDSAMLLAVHGLWHILTKKAGNIVFLLLVRMPGQGIAVVIYIPGGDE